MLIKYSNPICEFFGRDTEPLSPNWKIHRRRAERLLCASAVMNSIFRGLLSFTGDNFDGFASDKAYQWLTDNAYKYGFSLSYPKNNSHFVFEPWHWRFVGIELAKKLHDENKTLSDLDQREIDTYLSKFFD